MKRKLELLVVDERGRTYMHGKELKQYCKRGYLYISIERKLYAVHRLVAEKYIPKNKPGNTFVHHINSIRSDNRVSNLCWITNSENVKLGHSTGRAKGEKNGRAKLRSVDVKNIRAQLAVGVKGIDIAKRYGINYRTISKIKLRRLWD
jgi:hypothetical protein